MGKRKKYILTLSQYFPSDHPKASQITGFENNILEQKIHTIRANADLWLKRADEINSGKARLIIRKWTGKPYCSKQETICALTNIGVQRIVLKGRYTTMDGVEIPCWAEVLDQDGKIKPVKLEEIAYNDGLSEQDFLYWFRCRGKEDFSGIIIHFTDFRY